METAGTLNDKQLIAHIVHTIKAHLSPRRIVLFGSRVTGKGRPYSDFDIGIEGAEMDIRSERLIKEALDERLGVFTADIVNLDKVDLEFSRLVSKSCKVIYER